MPDYLQTDFDFSSDKLVDVFDEIPIWAAPFGLKLLDKIRFRKNIQVLDIGFGTGFPLTEIAMRLGNSSHVTGIDPWTAATRRAKKKIEFYGIRNISLVEGVAESIPMENESVDLIVSNNGLNNVADLDRVLSECARISRSGAQLVMTMNTEGSMIEFYRILESVLLDAGLHDAIPKIKQHITARRKPLGVVTSKLESHGFHVREIEEAQFNYTFIDGTSLLNHYTMRLAFLSGWKEIVPADKTEQVFIEAEKRMNQQAERDGFFKLSIPFVVIDCEKL